ncbi:MAG: hypothetical protein HQM16_11285 [Deltaproteobacteria bacterium]|nr:hypothetical protein [Deltaproteobacteria bacterium]
MAGDEQAKSRVLEIKGDKLNEQKKFKKAFEHYQQALELDEGRLELYDKLIKVHEEFIKDWTNDDFSYNVHLTMRKQEVMDPTFKRLNARHEPEYKAITQLVNNMLNAKDREIETRFVEEIVGQGPCALYPLIDFILGFKAVGKIKRAQKEKEQKTPVSP